VVGGALVAALAGTAFAGPGPGATDAAQHKLTKAQKKQVSKIAKKKAKKEAKKLDKKFLPIGASNLGSITERSGSTTDVAAGADGTATASCEDGEKVVGGGYTTASSTLVGPFSFNVPYESKRSNNGWRVSVGNTGTISGPLTAIAYCLDSNG
jgi:hypothetical protein